jgi:hypothetical protein
MIVYSVEVCHDYEGCTLMGVFQSKQEAEKYAEFLREWSSGDINVTQWDAGRTFAELKAIEDARIAEMRAANAKKETVE